LRMPKRLVVSWPKIFAPRARRRFWPSWAETGEPRSWRRSSGYRMR
jgi:hypothetical protein